MATREQVHARAVSKVRIEFTDGTYQELDDLESCRKWNEMANAQASNAYVHGIKFPPVQWKTGVIADEEEARAGLAALIYDIVLNETESFEFGHIGVSLAYLMGAILKGDKVDVYAENRDPNFGHLYSVLLTHCPEGHPVWKYINKRKAGD